MSEDEIQKDKNGNFINPFYEENAIKIIDVPEDIPKFDEINIIMSRMMRTSTKSTKEMTTEHGKHMVEYFYDRKVVNTNKAKLQLRNLIGISSRYIKEIYDSFVSWEIFVESGENTIYVGLKTREIDYSQSIKEYFARK